MKRMIHQLSKRIGSLRVENLISLTYLKHTLTPKHENVFEISKGMENKKVKQYNCHKIRSKKK